MNPEYKRTKVNLFKTSSLANRFCSPISLGQTLYGDFASACKSLHEPF